MPDDRDRYVDKVRKLLAKAEGTDNPAEAEIFFAKAAELITEWRIADAELTAVSAGAFERTTLPLGSYLWKVDAIVASLVMEPLGVRVSVLPYQPGYPAQLTVWGRRRDVDNAVLLWTSLTVQMASACAKAEAKTRVAAEGRGPLRTFRQSFRLGFARRINKRLQVATEAAATSAALVLWDEGLAQFMREHGVRDGRRAKITVDPFAQAHGDRAGQTADLGGPRLADKKKGELS